MADRHSADRFRAVHDRRILIGATRTAVMRNSVFVSTVVFFAAYYGLRGIAGNNALWFAFTAFLVMRGVLQYYMTNRLRII